MKNIKHWKPTRYVYHKGKLIASRDPKEVQISSRLIVDLIAEQYDFAMKDHVRGRLIDLGCGKVPLYHVYKDKVSENVCVDWKNTTHKNKHLDYQCDLTKKLPFKKNEFDTIILSDVLEHIPNPENLFREMSRILRVKGKLLLNVPFYYWLHEMPFDFYRYTEFALRRFADMHGFKIILIKSIGGFPEIIADVLAKNLVHRGRIGKLLSKVIYKSTYLFVKKTSLGKKISEDSSKNFPLGYFMVLEKT